MEDVNAAPLINTISNGESRDDEIANVHPGNLAIHENLGSMADNEEDKFEETKNDADNNDLKPIQLPRQDGRLMKSEDQVMAVNDEGSELLAFEGDSTVSAKELNGELNVLNGSESDTLQSEQIPRQGNDGEYSGCDIVRRSIRNRKSTDSRHSGIVKPSKSAKDSSTKKSRKPLPSLGSEHSKRVSSQIGSSKIFNLGTLRARKKVQRKRERKSGCSLRLSGGDPSPRPIAMAAPLTCAEYAQCLGLQPAVKFKCHKCGETNFASVGMFREHQIVCPGVVGGISSEEAAACATLAASGSNLHITQKLILCSACDTYFESWDLFLHMQSVHHRHICLFCLAMFSRAERLAVHLGSTHGASESLHHSADAFRSSRQSPCLLVCCTCECIFSDGDEFFDHSCHSGGSAGTSGENSGSTASGDGGESKGESSSGGKCSENLGHINDCSSGLDSLRNSNSHLGATDAESDCIMNNAANLCQLHIRVAAKKSLRRKDNVLVVIFDKSEQNGDQMVMRVEGKDSWETRYNGKDCSKPDDVEPLVDKNLSEDSLSHDCNCKSPSNNLGNANLEDMVDSLHKSLPLENPVQSGCLNEIDLNPSDVDNGPKSDASESSSDEMEKMEIEEKSSKSPESTVSKNTSNIADHHVYSDAPNSAEMQEPDAKIDLSASDYSQDEAKEESPPPEDCDEKPEVFQNSLSSQSDGDSPTKFESSTQPFMDNVNGNDCSSESSKSIVEEFDNLVRTPENKCEETLEPEDEEKNSETEKCDRIDLEESEHDVNQQNGIDKSSVQENVFHDLPDECGGIQVAGEDVSLTILYLDKKLEEYTVEDLLKEAVKASCFSCVYCTHAKKIAVNGKQLAFHLLAEHRFQPVINSPSKKEESEDENLHDSILEENHAESVENSTSVSADHLRKIDTLPEPLVDSTICNNFVEILKKSLDHLEKSCFNCDSYDNTNASATKIFSKTYECFQCRFSTGLHKELYIHNRKMHQKTNLLCIMCKCNFYSYSELLCHLCPGVYVPCERPNFRCCFCSADNLPSAFRFMVHLRKRHHACDVCLEVTGDQQRLSGHVWKHKLNHLCYRCDIAYRNKPDITKHLFWKHGTESVLCKRCLQKKWPHVYHFCVPPAVFTCEECGSTFSRAVALRVHRRLHLGEAPHACPECGQHFISRKLVNRHQEIKHGDLSSRQALGNRSDPENVAVDSKLWSTEDKDGPDNNEDLGKSSTDKNLQEQKPDENIDADGNDHAFNDKSSHFREGSNHDVPSEKSTADEKAELGNKPFGPDVEKTAKKVVDVMDLPPLNLSSESDESDDDELPVLLASTVNDNSQGCDGHDGEKQDHSANSPQQEEDSKPVEVVDGIWDNFKTYTAKLEDPKSNIGEPSSESNKSILPPEDIDLMARIINAEHDYCVPRNSTEENVEAEVVSAELKSEETKKSNAKEEEDGFDHDYCTNNNSKVEGMDVSHSSGVQETSPKKHPKSPKKKKKTASGSSSSDASDSSDSDSSSCSCGTNCSCSSSSSSSASSSSGSDSDSSVTSGRGTARASRKDRRKEGKRKKHLGNNSRQEEKAISGGDGGVQPPPGTFEDVKSWFDNLGDKEETPPLREVMIHESDLETVESETDEDFYDEQPRRFHSNAAAAMALARMATGSSPSAVAMEDISLSSPATSLQSPASHPPTSLPPSPTTSRQWQAAPPTPLSSLPPPITLMVPPPSQVPVLPPAPPIPEPEVRNPSAVVSEGFTPLIQPKKRGRKRKRPHIPSKPARKHAENDRHLSEQRTPTVKSGKSVRKPKVETPQQAYKPTPPVHIHNIHNSSGALLNSSVIHGMSEPTTPTTMMEGDLRLSKRKRVPKRFYGDSSDEEMEGGSGPVSSGSVTSSGGKLTIVLNQSGKVPKRKKSSVGPGSSVSFMQEPVSRSSVDSVSSLHQAVYQSHVDVDDHEIDTSSEREDNESQNGRSEGDSEGWSGDEEQNEGPSSCPLPPVSIRAPSQVPGESVGANTGSLYCYCQCPYDEVSEMIACDGKKCAIEWFHFECVGIMVPPKGKWYCPDCRKRCGSSGRTSDQLSGT